MSHDFSSNYLDWSIEQVNKTRKETVVTFLIKIRGRIKNLYNIPGMMGKERTKELFRQRVEFIKDELNILVKLNPILNEIDLNLGDDIVLILFKVLNLKFNIEHNGGDFYLEICKSLNAIICKLSNDQFFEEFNNDQRLEEFNYEDVSYGSPELEYI